MLSHPFYRAWTAGTLRVSSLRAYAAQYFRHVDAFPRYVSAVHSSCDSLPVRQALLENLVEEERGPDNHPALWLNFAAALGVTEGEVRGTRTWKETRQLVDSFVELTRHGTYQEGLAALLAYESQIPAVATAKIEGLARFYGVTEPRAIQFFSAHIEADALHSATSSALLDAHTPSSNEADVIAAAERARDALWTFLDGALEHGGTALASAAPG